MSASFFAEDIVFDIELYRDVRSFTAVNEPLYFYRYVATSLSNRYRRDLFGKLARLLDFMSTSATEYDLSDTYERILNTAFRFAYYGARNVKRAEELSHSEKARQIKEIANNPYVARALKTKRGSLKERVFAFLLRHKMAGIILALI